MNPILWSRPHLKYRIHFLGSFSKRITGRVRGFPWFPVRISCSDYPGKEKLASRLHDSRRGTNGWIILGGGREASFSVSAMQPWCKVVCKEVNLQILWLFQQKPGDPVSGNVITEDSSLGEREWRTPKQLSDPYPFRPTEVHRSLPGRLYVISLGESDI